LQNIKEDLIKKIEEEIKAKYARRMSDEHIAHLRKDIKKIAIKLDDYMIKQSKMRIELNILWSTFLSGCLLTGKLIFDKISKLI